MTESLHHLQLPLSEETARSLELGTLVTVTGSVFTGRSRFHIRAIEEDILPPLDFSAVNGFFHVGPVMREKEGAWDIISLEPTSSIRFERYGGAVVRKLGVRTLMGKTTMGPETTAALQDVGGVYLSKIGLCGNRLKRQVKCVQAVHFLEELGKTEASWVFAVERLGPFFVAIDAHGNNYFEQLDRDLRKNLPEIYASLGVPPGFHFTHVDAGSSVCKD